MKAVNLSTTAPERPDAWSSPLLGQVGSAGLKVLRRDGRPLPPETHDAAEAPLVLDGTLRRTADATEVAVHAGELYVTGAGVEHAVRPGSRGTLVAVERLAA